MQLQSTLLIMGAQSLVPLLLLQLVPRQVMFPRCRQPLVLTQKGPLPLPPSVLLLPGPRLLPALSPPLVSGLTGPLPPLLRRLSVLRGRLVLL